MENSQISYPLVLKFHNNIKRRKTKKSQPANCLLAYVILRVFSNGRTKILKAALQVRADNGVVMALAEQ